MPRFCAQLLSESAIGSERREEGRVRRDGRIYNYCPAPKVEGASTAGAGDSLLGGIIAAVASGIPFLRGDFPKESVASKSVETALELGVLLASYKCLSPHTINPSACVETLDAFARDLGKSFSNQVRELLIDTIST
jgi:sugar/nucleoside kinase (ribokinase family)